MADQTFYLNSGQSSSLTDKAFGQLPNMQIEE